VQVRCMLMVWTKWFIQHVKLKLKETKGILYIRATVSVWVVPGRFFQSLFVPYGDKQGKIGWPRRPLQRVGRGAISIKEIPGENRGTCI